ncbi:hypothetical protein R1flu_025846 [Riccia fluitans]|uniref:Uncharacterized protein n=1 Tax=Riccia fluitans TaxID=41844 RepID=A0ABD1XYX4_9MARC
MMNDHRELRPLLRQVRQFLRSKSWDTRVAAAQAIGAIAENVSHPTVKDIYTKAEVELAALGHNVNLSSSIDSRALGAPQSSTSLIFSSDWKDEMKWLSLRSDERSRQERRSREIQKQFNLPSQPRRSLADSDRYAPQVVHCFVPQLAHRFVPQSGGFLSAKSISERWGC